MSSVTGSDSSSSSNSSLDEVRRNREEYNKNESELVKRQQREIRRLNEKHENEVETLKASHDRQVQELEKHSRDSISERDQKHQSEIDNIRNMHRKQMQTNAEDTQSREDNIKKTSQSERESQKMAFDQKTRELTDRAKENFDERNAYYSKSLQENREDEARGLTDQRTKLQKSSQKELDAARNSRDQRIGQLQEDYHNYRLTTQRQQRQGEVQHLEDSERQSDNLLRAVKNEQKVRTDEEQRWQTDSESGLHTTQKHYKEALNKNTEAMEQARDNLEGEVHGRVHDEMQRMKSENESLKDGRAAYQRQMQMQKERELANVKDEFGRNVADYKGQRDDAYRLSNDRRTKDINALNEKNSQNLRETNRYYLEKANDQDQRLSKEYKTIDADNHARQDQLRSISEQRVKGVIEDTEQEKQRLIKYQQANHETMQEEQADKLKNLRTQADSDKTDAVERIKVQIRQNELTSGEKMAQTRQGYEHQINDLHDQIIRERKSADDKSQRLIEEMAREHKTELDQQQAKYEDRLRSLQNQQAEELRRVQQANQDKMQQLAAVQRKV